METWNEPSQNGNKAIGVVNPHYVDIISISWLAFFIAWAILAMIYSAAAEGVRSTGAEMGLRLLMVAGAYLSVRYGYALQPFGAYTERVAIAGAFICFLGLQFGIWARVTLGRNWGMPMSLHDNPEKLRYGRALSARAPSDLHGFGRDVHRHVARAPAFMVVPSLIIDRVLHVGRDDVRSAEHGAALSGVRRLQAALEIHRAVPPLTSELESFL